MFLKVFTIENPQQTQKEYPSELTAVVSFRDDYITWGRIEANDDSLEFIQDCLALAGCLLFRNQALSFKLFQFPQTSF